MIIFDENVEEYWIQLVKSKGFEYISIREICSGVTDIEVIDIARKFNGLVITEDKDFGELLFSFGVEKVSVLFMRYDQPQYQQIEEYFLKCLDDYHNNPEVIFITITKRQVRYRSF
jgi:predicted nuclease of predicted toxin-antitoxin system